MTKKINRRSFIKNSTAIGAFSIFSGSIASGFTSLKAGQSPVVSAVQGSDYYKNTLLAVKQLGGMSKFVSKGARVAVLANPQRNNPGAFTSPEVVRAVIDMCQAAGAAEVNFISWLPQKNWHDTGLLAVVKKGGASLKITNLRDESLFKSVYVANGKALKQARVMKELFNNDLLINVPITKDHMGNKFTGSLKNLMGLNSPVSNRAFHKPGWKTDVKDITHLDQSIADLNTVIKPVLSIVDATEFIITNGPFGPGKIHKPQKVVAGADRVAVDSYCCTLWGLKAQEIIMINKAYEHKLGEMDLRKVILKEVKI